MTRILEVSHEAYAGVVKGALDFLGKLLLLVQLFEKRFEEAF